jgi:hypothetical protein
LAADNYKGLQNTKVRKVTCNDHEIHIQFNPKRIISSSAKVDSKSISERPCFLCPDNRPVEQKGVLYRNDYVILVNPYPVFQRHLTIPSIRHLPQQINGNFSTMLSLAKELRNFSIIYNGPKCGASAPDHFHFQAIQHGVMPIENEFTSPKVKLAGKWKDISVYIWNNYLRHLITIAGSDDVQLENVFERIVRLLNKAFHSDDEPMINILAQHDGNIWIIHIFPRKKHRPAQYYAQGDDQILLSPASIDMGGVIIVPREKDFNRLTGSDIADIYDQVSVDENLINEMVKRLIKDDNSI